MQTSEHIDKIGAALAKAQLELGRLVADRTADAGTYSYSYANLAGALIACRGSLNANEIAVVQEPATSTGKGIEVRTTLVHASGQWMRSEPLFMPVAGNAQAVGSAITYARRYQLLAVVGLAPEDDDGRAASEAEPDNWGRDVCDPREAEAILALLGELIDLYATTGKVYDERRLWPIVLARAGVVGVESGNEPGPKLLSPADAKLVRAWLTGKVAEVGGVA